MPKNILQATPPSVINQPNPELLQREAFDAVIWLKGYNIIIEQAIACPCKGTTGVSQSTCQNCLGFGWVFIDPIRTKGIITGINKETKYRNWSPELIGTVAVSVAKPYRISHMDKITVDGQTSVMSESYKMKTVGVQRFAFLSYSPKTINHIFYWVANNQKLVRLPETAYSISPDNPYVILIDEGYAFQSGFNGALSIDYEHDVQYFTIDIPHDFRAIHVPEFNGIQTESQLPMQVIARKAHYVMDQPTTLAGNNIFDNSTR